MQYRKNSGKAVTHPKRAARRAETLERLKLSREHVTGEKLRKLDAEIARLEARLAYGGSETEWKRSSKNVWAGQ